MCCRPPFPSSAPVTWTYWPGWTANTPFSCTDAKWHALNPDPSVPQDVSSHHWTTLSAPPMDAWNHLSGLRYGETLLPDCCCVLPGEGIPWDALGLSFLGRRGDRELSAQEAHSSPTLHTFQSPEMGRYAGQILGFSTHPQDQDRLDREGVSCPPGVEAETQQG